jgi:hypothetical protein
MLYNLVKVLSLITSIGLSDMVEYFLNPIIHRVHNCLDIMNMFWKDYNAFLSGIKCSWFLMIPLIIFNMNAHVIMLLNIINVTVHISYNLAKVLSLITSIGLSDMVEYFLNPTIHRVHNCPDIMNMFWKDYNAFYAFLSGVKCSWFLMIPLIIFNMNAHVIMLLNIINVTVPIICYLTKYDRIDIFLSHKILYFINPILIISSLMI